MFMALFAGMKFYAVLAALAVAGGIAWSISAALDRVEDRATALAEKTIAVDTLQKVDAHNKAVIAEIKADQLRERAALIAARDAAESRARGLEQRNRRIASAPVTSSCVDSPAVRALLDGLRPAGTGGDGDPARKGEGGPAGTAAGLPR